MLYKFLAMELQRKRLLGRPRCTWEHNIKMVVTLNMGARGLEKKKKKNYVLFAQSAQNELIIGRLCCLSIHPSIHMIHF
jgi:hypothetical protein